jgi:hypothetical protein
MKKRKAMYIWTAAILAAVLVCTPITLGRFMQSFHLSDSALVAKFDVVITMPEEFDNSSDKNHYQHSFFDREEMTVFDFTASNNGEVDVNCAPYIIGVPYSVFISGQSQSEFVVKAGESVDFQLVIAAFNLTTGITKTEFIVDVKQYIGE